VYVSHHTTVYRNEVEALCALTPAAPTADCGPRGAGGIEGGSPPRGGAEGSAEGAPPDAPEWCAVLGRRRQMDTEHSHCTAKPSWQ